MLSFFNFLKNTLFFRAILGTQQLKRKGTQISHLPFVSTNAKLSPLATTPQTKVIHLLQMMMKDTS